MKPNLMPLANFLQILFSGAHCSYIQLYTVYWKVSNGHMNETNKCSGTLLTSVLGTKAYMKCNKKLKFT